MILKKNCFIYFHIGPNASKYLNETFPDVNTSYMYIQELEKRFNVTINWFNLEFVFDKLLIYNFIFKIYHNIKLNKNDKKYLK